MTRGLLLTILAAAPAVTAAAQEPVDPVTCRSLASDDSIEVEYEGRTYHVIDDVCRDAFLAEPERFAQLFDALAELESEGREAPPAASESLVPN